MKKAKAFLAKTLTAAIMITSLLPGSLLSVNAAEVQTSVAGWKVQKEYTNWSDEFDDFLNLDGIQTWHIESATTDGNEHIDMTGSSAPAVVYAKDIDITADNSEGAPHRIISFDVWPNDQKDPNNPEELPGTASDMRFGVFLKYVDETHWVFLGNQTTNNWFLQWNNGGKNSTEVGTNWKNLSGVDGQFSFMDNEYHRIIIEYISSSEIKLTLWEMEKDSSDNWVTAGSPTEKTIGTADFQVQGGNQENMLQAIRDYAAVTSQSPKKIHFGFKAGSGSVQNVEGKILTKVDVANVMTNANKEHEMRSLRYAYCGWTSPKGKKANEIMSVRSDGGINYVSIDASTAQTPKTVGYENDALDDFSEGTVSAVFRPYINDTEKEGTAIDKAFSLNARAVTPDSPEGTVKVGFNGTNWGYQLGDGQWVNATGDNLAAPKYMREYKVDMSFTGDNKFSAEVIEVERDGNENTSDADYKQNDYSVTAQGATPIKIADNVSIPESGVSKAGSISVTAGDGLFLRFRNVNYAKTAYQSATDFLGTAYTAVMNRNNDDNTYYTAAWNVFNQARTTADTALKADGTITEQEAKELLQDMEDAWTALDNDVNKIEPDRLLLEAAKSDLEAKSDKTYYSYDEEKFNEAKNAVDTQYAQVSVTPAGAVKEDVTAALDKYDQLEITPVEATAEDLKKAEDAVTKATDGIDASEAEFYDNWDAYQEALDAVKALNATSSKKEIDEAIARLEEAVANRTLKAADQSDRDALKTSIAAIKAEVEKNLQPNAAYNAALQKAEALANGSDATTKKALSDALKALETAKNALPKKVINPTPTVTVGQVVTSGGMDYTVTNVTAKTVVLKEGKNPKQTKVTIPDTVAVGTDSYKVVGIVANAFKNYKNIKNITIGANVASIEKKAFPNCAKLTKITFKTSKVTLKKNAFGKVKKTVKVKAPKSLKKNKKFLRSLKKAGVKKYK